MSTGLDRPGRVVSEARRSVALMDPNCPRPGLVRPVCLDPTGRRGPTRGQARARRWRRSTHGFYVPSNVDGELAEQRILEASVLVSAHGAITGWAALRWLGGRWFSGIGTNGVQLPIPLLIGTQDLRPQPAAGIAVCGEGCIPERILVVDGVRVTEPAWTVAFLMRHALGVRRGVLAFDMAAYSDLASEPEVRAVIEEQYSWTGVPQARDAIALVSENSWSPQETYLRLAWTLDADLPTPLANRPIFDLAGRHLATPDLVDDHAGVVGEYDGPDHLDRVRRIGDINRDELLCSHGLEVVRSMAGDTPDDLVHRLRGAYARAARRTDRRWTTVPPPWWTPTHAVDLRRALSEADRSRLLRYRAA